MKNAYELAMEKYSDDPVKKLTDEQKKALAEIENLYQSKIAEAKVMNQDRLIKAGGDLGKIEQIKNDFPVELASLNEKCEIKKERIRNESQ